jgi:hypothetical protein
MFFAAAIFLGDAGVPVRGAAFFFNSITVTRVYAMDVIGAFCLQVFVMPVSVLL